MSIRTGIGEFGIGESGVGDDVPVANFGHHRYPIGEVKLHYNGSSVVTFEQNLDGSFDVHRKTIGLVNQRYNIDGEIDNKKQNTGLIQQDGTQ